MTTLKDVASAAGVHVATASAVLNSAGGNTRVSPGTRERVLEAAQRLAYLPNESARRLRQGKSDTVGFLGGDLRNPFFAELTAAVECELRQYGLQLMVSHIGNSGSASPEKTIRMLQQQGLQRIIRWEEASRPEKRPAASESLILSIGFTRQERPGVWLDLGNAIRIAVEEMIRRGCRQLGFLAPSSHQESPSVAARSQLFVKECKRQKIPAPILAGYPGESWDLDAAALSAGEVLKTHPEVEGWIGFNDVSSLGLLSRLSKKDSARVLCFDGTMVTRCWPGRPSRLDLQISGMACLAAAVVAEERSAVELGSRMNWLRPTLIS